MPNVPTQPQDLPIVTTVESPRVNRLQETKLDAEFNFLERVRQDEARKEHEAKKAEILRKHREQFPSS